MNSSWLKIAVLIVVAAVIVILVRNFWPSKTQTQPQENPKSFYEIIEEDKDRFLAEPEPLDSQQQEPVSQQGPAPESETIAKPVQPTAEPPKPAGPTTLYFKELSEINKIEAERLLNVAVPGRSIGRLPMSGFKLMVDNCRQIIRRWPDSWYAYRAKQLLADMPERYQQRYNVTPEELDVSRFAEPRAGTKPFTVKESR